MPNDALLPSVCLSFFVPGRGCLRMSRGRAPRRTANFSYWDAAGVLTFIGIVIAAEVEPEQMVRLVAGPVDSPEKAA